MYNYDLIYKKEIKNNFCIEQNKADNCLMYGFGYTFQFSQMMKSTSVPSKVLFSFMTIKKVAS